VEFPLRPMIAVSADGLPESPRGDWSYEAKFDGFRCLAHRRAARVALQSRQQRPLTRYFPEIVAALEQLDTAVVLDGELVLWREGRLDFAALQGWQVCLFGYSDAAEEDTRPHLRVVR
jgi:ATP-dependent DNA ligase